MEAHDKGSEQQHLVVSAMALTEYEQMCIELMGDSSDEWITPGQAREKLDRLGYDESDWQTVLDESGASHHLRGLMIIAQGEIPRLSWVLQLNFRALDYEYDPHARPVFDDPTMQTEALRAKINTD